MRRDHWQRRTEALDPEADFAEIYTHEFPWELEHGFGSASGRGAVRRMNQMHGAYAISNDDMRYVQSTFVVIPMRWLDRFGWRPLTETERRASANYYRELGRHMNIKDSPATYQEFAAYLDAYERAHFAYSPGGRAVSDSTLALLTSFSPRPLRPLMRRLTLALLDPPLREAFRYPRPDPGDAGTRRRRPPCPRRRRAPPAAPARAALRPRSPRVRDLPRRLRHRATRHLPAPLRA